MRSRNTRFTAKPASNPEDPSVNEEERGLVEILDELAMFQDLRADLIPKLRSLVESKASPDEIFQSARSIAAARLASMAAANADDKVALVAIKELLEHTDQKLKDKPKDSDPMRSLKDEELRAIVLSKLNDQA